ncbi:MAG: ATP-dependent DNA helicase, partial [Clostridia bacterium]|nr:ATP-dependent DNA helicase [Clostridia bacterium]
SQLLHLQRALHENREKYACLLRTGSTRIKAFRLDAADHFASATQGMAGVVCFSATLDPLPEMKRLLGGEAEDACFSVPSPFPRENLLVVHSAINMRYSGREQSVPELCGMIRTLFSAKQGKYIVFFPSFAFLRMAQETLSEWTEENRDTMLFQAQTAGMGLEARDAFLAPYLSGDMPVLSFCVLGGVFAEGIDLPGDCLDGVLIAGVGLPMVCQEQNALSDWYEKQYGDGFLYAYILPGLQKVAQAAGRVIRSETDRGVVWLADDRFLNVPYVHLLPRHWEIRRGVPGQRLERFYARENPAIDAGSQS